MNPASSELRRDGQPLKADALVIDLLGFLASRAGELVTHEQLIAHVWEGRAVADNVVSVCVAKLRKALGHRRGEREFVVNVYGRGYRFVRPVRRIAANSEPPPRPAERSSQAAQFVGREAVMARLRAGLQDASAHRGRVCALLGEPGIGKTRVAEALEQQALELGMRIAWGRSRELEGAPPLWPWVQVLRELLAVVSIEGAQVHLGKSFGELLRLLPEHGTAAEIAGIDAAERYRTFDAVARLLALAGQEAPWLVVLDDLHRGDAGSFELLDYLVDELPRLRVLIVCTLRNTEPPALPAGQRNLDYLLGHRNSERIELARLLPADVTAYTTAVLGRADDDLARVVFDKSEGIPFFMTELMRDVVHGGESSAREPTLPGAALDLVRQRVRKLGDEAHRMLATASVIGRSFDLALLALVTEVPASALLESLDEALATEVVVAAPDGMSRFAFGHDLIRAVLYEELPSNERARLHLLVAEALAQRQLAAAPAEIAHHLLQALPHGDTLRAVEYAERAADAAIAALAYADSAAMLRRALAALDQGRIPAQAMRCNLHLRLSLCLRALGAPESIEHLRKVVALASENRLYDVLAVVGQALVSGPGLVAAGDARSALEQALEGLPESAAAVRASVLAHLSWCAPYCFDREQSGSLCRRALQAARASQSRTALLTALRAQIHHGAGPCRPEAETRALVDEAEELVSHAPSRLRTLWTLQWSTLRAVLATQRGDRAGVDRALELGAHSAHELQHAELIWHSDRMRVVDRMNSGALRDIEPQLRSLQERGKRLQLFAHEVVCGYDVLVWLRQTTELGQSVTAAVPTAPRVPANAPGLLALQMRAALSVGRNDGARAILGEFARGGFERLPCDRDYLGTLGHLGLAAAKLAEHEHARALYALLQPHADRYTADISLHSDGSVSHVLGLLASVLDRPADAIAHFEHAIARNDGFGLHARAAESRYQLALCLLVRDAAQGRGRARELLGRVQGTARALGLRPLLARAQALERDHCVTVT